MTRYPIEALATHLSITLDHACILETRNPIRNPRTARMTGMSPEVSESPPTTSRHRFRHSDTPETGYGDLEGSTERDRIEKIGGT